MKFYNLATLSILTGELYIHNESTKRDDFTKPLINLKQEETGNSASGNGGIGGFGPSLPLITSRIPGFNVNKLFEGIIELPR